MAEVPLIHESLSLIDVDIIGLRLSTFSFSEHVAKEPNIFFNTSTRHAMSGNGSSGKGRRLLVSPKPFFKKPAPFFTIAKLRIEEYLKKCLDNAHAEYGAFCYEVSDEVA